MLRRCRRAHEIHMEIARFRCRLTTWKFASRTGIGGVLRIFKEFHAKYVRSLRLVQSVPCIKLLVRSRCLVFELQPSGSSTSPLKQAIETMSSFEAQV